VGVVSYKYTLNKDKVAGHKRKRINFSSKIIEERFNRHRNNKITSLAKEHDIYKRLYNNVSSLVFDYESAREYANKLDPGLVKDSVHQRINAEENNFTIFKKDRNNRIYTNFTVTHRVLRTFYSFPNGEDIYMADISACHPWFFFSLYKEDSEEKQKFKSLFDADGFWNNLFFQLYGKKMIAEEKDVFKKKFFKYIGYSRTVAVLKQDIFIKFKETFPILSKLIDEKKNPSHADFANSNMQLESKIMFRAIELGNFTQFLWVHDALYSTEREIFNVVKILKQSFAQEGLFPQIEVKKITREKLSIQESIHNAPHALT
jgi:hypothetical protein